MRAGRAVPFIQRFEVLSPAIERVFDLETVLKVSVGQRWDALDADTRSLLLKVYRRFTVATYVANFDKYDGERFRILPTIRDSGADRIVATEILTGGDHIRLDYVMRDTAGTWRAVDVLLEGSDQPGRRSALGLPEDPRQRRCWRADRQPAPQDQGPVGRRAQLMIAILAGIAAVLAGIGMVEVVLASLLVARFARRTLKPSFGNASVAAEPPISVLKPLHGDDILLEEALTTLCRQSYPHWQIVFGVQDPNDPAIEVVQRLRQRFPAVDIDLVIDSTPHGRNRKVGNLINMMPAARHDILVIADADVHVRPDYLSRLAAALAHPGVGLVTTLYAGLPAGSPTASEPYRSPRVSAPRRSPTAFYQRRSRPKARTRRLPRRHHVPAP